MSDTIHTVSTQWAARPADQRFESLTALAAYKAFQKKRSVQAVIPNRNVAIVPSASDAFDLGVMLKSATRNIEYLATPTHWAFGQLCARASAPAGYMRSGLPAALVADCLNWGLHHNRAVEDVQVLFHKREDDSFELQATTGPDYGRVWDADIAETLVRNFGDGVTGDWRVPGEFGKRVTVDKDNTTLYASDSDMFVFLADEDRRIELPNRRNGETGSLARGFYISNSQVGKSPLVFGMFLFDYVCCNRIIWGATQKHEIRIIHRAGAPNRWIEEVRPILDTYAHSSPMPVEATLRAAQARKIDSDVQEFLASRFGKGPASLILATHEAEEQRPIETIWDAVTGATAYARSIPHQDQRVAVEREAGKLLARVAA
jgi:hypothetical protein